MLGGRFALGQTQAEMRTLSLHSLGALVRFQLVAEVIGEGRPTPLSADCPWSRSDTTRLCGACVRDTIFIAANTCVGHCNDVIHEVFCLRYIAPLGT